MKNIPAPDSKTLESENLYKNESFPIENKEINNNILIIEEKKTSENLNQSEKLENSNFESKISENIPEISNFSSNIINPPLNNSNNFIEEIIESNSSRSSEMF